MPLHLSVDRLQLHAHIRTASTIVLLLLFALSLGACNRDDADQPSPEPTAEQAETPQPTDSLSADDPLATLLAATVPPATSLPVNEPILKPTDELIINPTSDTAGASTAGNGMILVPTQTPEPTPIPVGRVLAALVNVRSAPATSAGVVGTLEGGARLQILDRSVDGKWLRVCCSIDERAGNGEKAGELDENIAGSDVEQWVDARYLEIDQPVVRSEEAPDSVDAQTELASNQGLVNADLINLRGGPDTRFPTIGQASKGQILDLTGRNESSNWLQVCCTSAGDQTSAWVSAQFVTMAADAAITDLALAASPPIPEAPQAVGGAQVPEAPAAAPGLPGDGGFGASGGTNPLTGLPLGAVSQGVRPIIVCINNDYAARPQYGTSQADVMYEYIMEGYGITRFSGVFLGESADQIGPVRSARLINYYLGALFNAGLACSGASDGVRYLLKHQAPFPYMDVDLDDASNTRYSVSLGSDYRTRLRTSVDKLRRWLADWGVEEPARLRGFTFGGPPAGGAPASGIAIPYPSATGSQAAFAYDGGLGAYRRSMGGAPHLDGNTGAQIAVENVVVQYVPHQSTDIVEDSLGSTSIRLNLFGSGRSVVFRDGKAYPGTWRSESRGDMPRFYTDSGEEVPLKPGKTWVSVVPTDYAVSYQ